MFPRLKILDGVNLTGKKRQHFPPQVPGQKTTKQKDEKESEVTTSEKSEQKNRNPKTAKRKDTVDEKVSSTEPTQSHETIDSDNEETDNRKKKLRHSKLRTLAYKAIAKKQPIPAEAQKVLEKDREKRQRTQPSDEQVTEHVQSETAQKLKKEKKRVRIDTATSAQSTDSVSEANVPETSMEPPKKIKHSKHSDIDPSEIVTTALPDNINADEARRLKALSSGVVRVADVLPRPAAVHTSKPLADTSMMADTDEIGGGGESAW